MMNKYLLATCIFMTPVYAHAATQDLIDAVKNNDFNAVRQLIAEGEDVNGINIQGNSALHYAVAMDNADMTKILLENGANMNLSNDKGWTPLKIAEKKNVEHVTAVLVEELQKEQAEAHRIALEEEQARNQDIKNAREKEIQQEKNENSVEQSESAASNNEVNNAVVDEKDVDVILVQKLQNAVLATEKAREEAVAAQKRAEDAAKILEAKVKELQADNGKKSEVIPVKSNIKKPEPAKSPVKSVSKPVPHKVVKLTPPPSSKPKPKPIVLVKSAIIEGIYAGDEEIVYCMNILGQGENHYMIPAAGYYASSVGIKEMRYNQIMELADKYYTGAAEKDLAQRVAKCSDIVTPKDKVKQNQIIRSLNYTIGK